MAKPHVDMLISTYSDPASCWPGRQSVSILLGTRIAPIESLPLGVSFYRQVSSCRDFTSYLPSSNLLLKLIPTVRASHRELGPRKTRVQSSLTHLRMSTCLLHSPILSKTVDDLLSAADFLPVSGIVPARDLPPITAFTIQDYTA
jgi:hypothetical protein